MHVPTPPSRPWTWADQVSTYRFWGLVGAWMCVTFGMSAMRTELLGNVRLSMSYADLAVSMAVAQPLGMVAGVVLGLLLVRGHAVRWLLLSVVLLGLLLPGWMAYVQEAPTRGSMVWALGSAQLLAYSWLLAIPAVLAGGRSGTVTLACTLAVAWLLKGAVDLAAPAAVMYLASQAPMLPFLAGSVMAAALAVALLLPLLGASGQTLFSAEPPVRHRPLVPRARHPLVVAAAVAGIWVAALIYGGCAWLQMIEGVEPVAPGWYWLAHACLAVGLVALVCWNYRIHGELALLAPSPELLTPRAAAWASVLMPLAGLLLPLQLAQVVNQAQPGRLSIGWLVCWSLLLPPVALALVQRAVNQMAAAQGRTPVPA